MLNPCRLVGQKGHFDDEFSNIQIQTKSARPINSVRSGPAVDDSAKTPHLPSPANIPNKMGKNDSDLCLSFLVIKFINLKIINPVL